MAVNGYKIIIKLDGTAIAATKSNEINVGCETIETASSTNGDWKSHIAGRKEWSVTTSFLLLSDADIKNRLYPGGTLAMGETYTLTICSNGSSGTTHLTGTAILNRYQVAATVGNLVTGNFSFIGTSALS